MLRFSDKIECYIELISNKISQTSSILQQTFY